MKEKGLYVFSASHAMPRRGLRTQPRVEWREDKELLGRFFPRRDYRTQPRVLTLGTNQASGSP
jgi:hypothetical protein